MQLLNALTEQGTGYKKPQAPGIQGVGTPLSDLGFGYFGWSCVDPGVGLDPSVSLPTWDIDTMIL